MKTSTSISPRPAFIKHVFVSYLFFGVLKYSIFLLAVLKNVLLIKNHVFYVFEIPNLTLTTVIADASSSSRQDVHAPAANLTQQKKTAALREKMDVMREKRRVNDMLGSVFLSVI